MGPRSLTRQRRAGCSRLHRNVARETQQWRSGERERPVRGPCCGAFWVPPKSSRKAYSSTDVPSTNRIGSAHLTLSRLVGRGFPSAPRTALPVARGAKGISRPTSPSVAPLGAALREDLGAAPGIA